MNLPSQISLIKEVVFQNIEESCFENLELEKLLIKNSIIKKCNFININLSHCDLLSSKLYNVSFKKVSFTCADIFSLWFSECEFDNVDFSGAGIEDITFINCHFNNCKFENVGLKKCIFINTTFYNISPKSCGFILNQYDNCYFKSCEFRSSFQYQIFDKCKFENVKMDYSILKYNFGMDTNGRIVYFKNDILIQESNLLYQLVLEECLNQKLFLNAYFVSLNFECYINPQLIFKSFDAIETMLSKEFLIRNDELFFLKQLYQYMYENQLIPPIVLYLLSNKIKNLIVTLHSNIAYKKSSEALHIMYNDLYLKFCEFFDKLQEDLENLPYYEEPLRLYISYDNEPSIPLAELLNQCLPNTFVRIQSEYGSFHEIIEMLPQGIDILNIFLQILGISIPIVYSEIKDKQKQQCEETKIEKSINFNIVNKNNTKDTTKLIQQTCKTIASSGILNENLQGYNNNNIKEIKILYNINIQA